MDNQKLAEAIRLIQVGKKLEGANILANMLSMDPRIEVAWLWLYVCVETNERKVYCLQRALDINPERAGAREALETLLRARQHSDSKFSPDEVIQPSQDVKCSQEINSQSKVDEPKNEQGEQIRINQLKREEAEEEQQAEVESRQSKQDAVEQESHAHVEASWVEQGKVKWEGKKPAVTRQSRRKKLKAKRIKARRTHQPALVKKEGENDSQRHKRREIVIPNKKPTVIFNQPGTDDWRDDTIGSLKNPMIDTASFGTTLVINEVRINPNHLPKCLKIGFIRERDCDVCEFLSPYDCALKDDAELFEVARIYIVGARQRYYENKKRLNSAIRAIYNELKAHGRPLHYSVLAKMVIKRYPKLKLTEMRVLGTMRKHPEFFRNIGEGVFQCKV